MELTPQSGIASPIDLIPKGFLCWVRVTFRGMKISPTTGSRYADLELTVAERQPHARKKIFTKIGDPDHKDNSEKYRQMGTTNLTRMVEAAGLVKPEDKDSYLALNGKACEDILMLLDQPNRYVAIKVKIENGTGGYEDKNDVGEYLSPNKESQSHKNYVRLLSGDHGVTTGNQRQSGFAPQTMGPPTQRQSGFAQAAEEPKPEAKGEALPPPPQQTGFNPNATPSYLRQGP